MTVFPSLRTNALDLLASLSVNLQARQNLDRDDRELIAFKTYDFINVFLSIANSQRLTTDN
jgi:hypothetical protein